MIPIQQQASSEAQQRSRRRGSAAGGGAGQPAGAHCHWAGPPRAGFAWPTHRQPSSSKPRAAPPARRRRSFRALRFTPSRSASSPVVMASPNRGMAGVEVASLPLLSLALPCWARGWAAMASRRASTAARRCSSSELGAGLGASSRPSSPASSQASTRAVAVVCWRCASARRRSSSGAGQLIAS